MVTNYEVCEDIKEADEYDKASSSSDDEEEDE